MLILILFQIYLANPTFYTFLMSRIVQGLYKTFVIYTAANRLSVSYPRAGQVTLIRNHSYVQRETRGLAGSAD